MNVDRCPARAETFATIAVTCESFDVDSDVSVTYGSCAGLDWPRRMTMHAPDISATSPHCAGVRMWRRFGAPLTGRIDIHIEVPAGTVQGTAGWGGGAGGLSAQDSGPGSDATGAEPAEVMRLSEKLGSVLPTRNGDAADSRVLRTGADAHAGC